MLTEKDYCDKDTAFALQELGYYPYMFYDDGTPAIHLWYAQKWLREERNIDVLIELETKDIHLSSKYYSIHISYMSRFRREFSYISQNFDSYEKALSEGIKEAIKILKEK
jgi:hypothetical protein